MPKVSVIIPCYNLGQYLDIAVDSILAQSFRDFEIIIVNDGSTDDFTNRLLDAYDKEGIGVISQNNRGLPSARNSGIKNSSGDYILCLDADDRLHKQFLEKTVPILDADISHECAFVMPWAQLFGDVDYLWKTSEYDPYLLAMRNDMHCTALFRRECWTVVGGYKEHMSSGYEDWDFWLSIVASGYKWVTVKEPLFYYRKRSGSMISKCDGNRLALFSQIIKNNETFYRLNYDKIILRGFQYFEAKLKTCESDFFERLTYIHNLELYQSSLIDELNNCNSRISDLTKTLDSIKSSLSWKLTSPLRSFIDLFR